MESTSLLLNLALVMGATILSVIGPDIVRFFPEGSIRSIVLSLLGVAFLLYGFGYKSGADSLYHNVLKKAYCDHRPLWMRLKTNENHYDDTSETS